MKRLLSIDGGGERGTIPCVVLMHIEEMTGKPISETFDLMGGTSTGGILVCCLKKGIPAKDILGIYQSEASTIFNRAWYHSVLDHFGLLGTKYPADGIESVLNKYMGDSVVGSDAPFILIPSLSYEDGCPRIFKTGDDKDLKLSYVARASSAAPTYFPPKDGLIDGGMFANDPSMCVLAEAYKLWGDEQLKMLSIGTGFTKTNVKPGRGGILNWATSLIDIFMNGEMGFAEYQTSFVMGAENYCRIQGEIPAGIDAKLDDIDPANIQKLIDFGSQLFDQNKAAIQAII